ncbi:cell wall-binding repeat-containing protein [Oceanobacillus luteolus]|uniref:cell wall-binding repeat-containing protein n=1 Tax=Oceanobacillus luteolus TaxID=1274358 RepID=UPI00203FA151|nr:cell wall-binding repeat-containing protein [Oceanobacillus luteolus]MCM3742065.1 cell wall-binding repeat-containing protein [Oceanobacillus luteolus]
MKIEFQRITYGFLVLILLLGILVPSETFATKKLEEDGEEKVLHDMVIGSSEAEETAQNPEEDYYVTVGNEKWEDVIINQDVYIGPKSIVTVDGNVQVNGDVYVYGAIRSEGGLFINGTLNAKRVLDMWSVPIYQGEVQLRGVNNFEKVSNKVPYEIPFFIYNEDLTNKTRTVVIEGKTLPFLDVYADGEEVALDEAGIFTATVEDMITDRVEFELTDNFGGKINKTVEIKDVIPPATPQVEEVTEDTTEITGKAEAYSTVDATVSGDVISTVEAREDGSFSLPIKKLEAGTEIVVTATDRAGNISEAVKVVVVDITAPAAPQVAIVSEKSTSISGTAEPGSTVVVKADDRQIGRITVGADGKFVLPIVKQPAGTVITVTATDKADNESEATVIIVKAEVERISGYMRYDTAVEVSKQGWNSADTVIITRGDDFADALAGVPLAYQLDAPILMTPSKRLWDNTLEEIKRLGAEHAIILGGEGAVSKSVAKALEDAGLEVERINGSSRFETAALIAERIAPEGIDNAVIANGMDFPDALSVASYAAKEGLPILLTMNNKLANATEAAVEELGVKETIVVGGKSVVAENVERALPQPTRLGGNDRYETNIEIAAHFGLDTKHIYVATGQNYADALSGGVLAAKENSAILLVHHRIPSAVSDYMKKENFESLSIFGGTGAVDSSVEEDLRKLLR